MGKQHFADPIPCPIPQMHTHVLCPDCGAETVVNGYASIDRCGECDQVNAQAIVVCNTLKGQEVHP